VPRVDPTFITHKLNVDPLVPPKKQKLRRSAKSYVEVVKEEVENRSRWGLLRRCSFRVSPKASDA